VTSRCHASGWSISTTRAFAASATGRTAASVWPCPSSRPARRTAPRRPGRRVVEIGPRDGKDHHGPDMPVPAGRCRSRLMLRSTSMASASMRRRISAAPPSPGAGSWRAFPLRVALCAAVDPRPPPLASGGLRYAGCDCAQFSYHRGIFQRPGRPATPVTDLLSNIGKSSNRGERVVVEPEDGARSAQTAQHIRDCQRHSPRADLPRVDPCQPGAELTATRPGQKVSRTDSRLRHPFRWRIRVGTSRCLSQQGSPGGHHVLVKRFCAMF